MIPIMSAEKLRQLEPLELLLRLKSHVELGILLAEKGLSEGPPLKDFKKKPLLHIGDFTVFPREEFNDERP